MMPLSYATAALNEPGRTEEARHLISSHSEAILC